MSASIHSSDLSVQTSSCPVEPTAVDAKAFTSKFKLFDFRIFIVVLAWSISYLLPGALTHVATYYTLTLLFALYLTVEVRSLISHSLLGKVLNPMVIASIGTFGCSMGAVLNLFYFVDDYSKFDFSFLSSNTTIHREYVIYTLCLAITCSAVTWSAYYSNLGQRLYEQYLRVVPTSKFLDGEIDSRRLFAWVVAAILIRCWLFSLGLHGRLVSSEYFDVRGQGYAFGSEYRHLGNIGYLSIVFAYLACYRSPTRINFFLRGVLLTSEMFFGMIYGARSAIILPSLVAFVAATYCQKKISWKHVVFVVGSTVLAMTLGNQFKSFGIEKGYRENVGAVELLVEFLTVDKSSPSSNSHVGSPTEFVEVFARNKNKFAESAAAVQYSHTSDSNWFRNKAALELVAAPIHGFLPRGITKLSRPSWGFEFKNRVLHRNLKARYSIAAGPLGFLYMSGGVLAILVAGVGYGVALRFTSAVATHGDLGFLLYLALMSVLYDVHTVVPDVIVNVIRMLILMPLVFWVLFKR